MYYPSHYFEDEKSAQTASIHEALRDAKDCLCVERMLLDIDGSSNLATRFRVRRYAYLNRACELACVPLHQRYVETSNGAELAWFTYRPEAIPNEPYSWPDAVVQVGYVDDLTETEARSRAIGW